jgi:predicted protein tyrosine phosphatase
MAGAGRTARWSSLGTSRSLETDSAGTEPVATSPETDAPIRLREIVVLLSTRRGMLMNRSISRYSQEVSLAVSSSYQLASVSMLCKNQDRDEM